MKILDVYRVCTGHTDVDQTDFLTIFARPAKPRDRNCNVGMACPKGASRHRGGDLGIHRSISLGVFSGDAEHLAFGVDRIDDEAALKMNSERGIGCENRCELTAGAAFGCHETQRLSG